MEIILAKVSKIIKDVWKKFHWPLFKDLMNIHHADDDGERTFGKLFGIALFTAVCILGFITLLIFYDGTEGGNSRISFEKLGAFGDFVGGLLNPLLAFLVLMVLLATTKLQKKELSETRSELRKTADISQQQAFEATFFNLMKLINENVRATKVWDGSKDQYGVDAFKHMHYELRRPSTRLSGDLLFKELYPQFREELGHYIRTLYWTLSFIRDEELSGTVKREKYGKILRAQLSDFELAILFYNCLSDYGKNFRPLARYFNLFNSLADELIFNPSHKDQLQELYDQLD